MIEADFEFLNNIVTCDESWVFTYDPESKRQSAQWKHGTSPRPKKGKNEQIVREGHGHSFFDSQGHNHVEWVSQGQTDN